MVWKLQLDVYKRQLLEVLCQDSADLRVQRKNGSEKSEEERDSSCLLYTSADSPVPKFTSLVITEPSIRAIGALIVPESGRSPSTSAR